jgi:hypothetical protein
MMTRQISLAFIAGILATTLGLLMQTAKASKPTADQAQPVSSTLASVVDGEIRRTEEQFLELAEAMPEDKFNFSPESLHLPGASYQGVRTFATQLKHVATSNYYIWCPVAGERLPEGLGNDGNGPADLKTKGEILKFLKASFALGHRAAATLTVDNMLQTVPNSKSTRLRLAEFGVAHAYDHYGQLVEYLRMNGIVPPASRTKSE